MSNTIRPSSPLASQQAVGSVQNTPAQPSKTPTQGAAPALPSDPTKGLQAAVAGGRRQSASLQKALAKTEARRKFPKADKDFAHALVDAYFDPASELHESAREMVENDPAMRSVLSKYPQAEKDFAHALVDAYFDPASEQHGYAHALVDKNDPAVLKMPLNNRGWTVGDEIKGFEGFTPAGTFNAPPLLVH